MNYEYLKVQCVVGHYRFVLDFQVEVYSRIFFILLFIYSYVIQGLFSLLCGTQKVTPGCVLNKIKLTDNKGCQA